MIAQSPFLFGRDSEVETFALALTKCAHDRRRSLLVIRGASGVGKTAFLSRACQIAEQGGWGVFRSACYSGEKNVPNAILQRLLDQHRASISNAAHPYLSGLERDLELANSRSYRFAQAFARLFEAVLSDSPCMLAIDDAHWLDAESVSTLREISRTCYGSQLIIVTTERMGIEAPRLDLLDASVLVLEPLHIQASRQLVTHLWPVANETVVAAIIDRSLSLPFDIIALCEQARAEFASETGAIADTSDNIVRESVIGLTHIERAILQLCSVVREPIDSRLLSRVLADPDSVERFLMMSGSRYLQTEGHFSKFRHARIAAAVRSTIDRPSTLRRAVLGAYRPIASLDVAELSAVAALADDAGDEATEFEALCRLGHLAFEERAFESAAAAYRRAAAIMAPKLTDYFPFYNEFSIALRLSGRWEEAQRVLERAVQEGLGRNLLGVGELAAALVWLIRLEKDRDVARAQYCRLEPQIINPSDRHALLAIGAHLACEAQDLDSLEVVRSEVCHIGEPQPPYATVIMGCGKASLFARQGKFEEAWASLDEARCNATGPSQETSVDCFSRHVEVRQHGCLGFDMRVTRMLKRDQIRTYDELPQAVALYARELAVIVDFSRGRWAAAQAHLDPGELSDIRPCRARTLLLAMGAAIAALSLDCSALAELIEDELRSCFRRDLWQRAMPLGFWWAASIARERPSDAAAFVEPLCRHLARTDDATAFSFPIAPVLYAARLGDRPLLEKLVKVIPREASPWHAAQSTFARGFAYSALGDAASARRDLMASEADFRKLGATFFAACAAKVLGICDTSQNRMLTTLQIDLEPVFLNAHSSSTRRRDPTGIPTLREREVAELVADGYSNRGIADRLTISERTVEVHISNLFNKLNIGSRTQVVRWVLDESSVPARAAG